MVRMESWPREIWICSRGELPRWASLAKVRRRSCGRQFHPDLRGVGAHNQVDGLGGEPRADFPALGDRAQEAPFGDPGGSRPLVRGGFGPGGHGDAAQAVSFAFQIDEHPAALALLDGRDGRA